MHERNILKLILISCMITNLMFHACMNHIEIDSHFVHNKSNSFQESIGKIRSLHVQDCNRNSNYKCVAKDMGMIKIKNVVSQILTILFGR
jgi:hypothetical protein